MQFDKYVLGTLLLSALGLASCVDDKYDLSDIDTTVRVEVNDLVIPVNIDELTLKSVIKPKPGDRIQDVDGVYAVIEEGHFDGEGIKVDAVRMDAPTIESTSNSIHLPEPGKNVTEIPGGVLKVDIFTDPTTFTAEDDNVTSSIVSVKRVGTEFDITMALTLKEFAGKLKTFSFKNFEMQLPKGLELTAATGTYDPATGLYTAADLKGTKNVLELEFKVAAVTTEGGSLVYTVNGDSRKLTFEDAMCVKSAELEIAIDDFVSASTTVVPATLTLDTSYTMTDIEVNDFSGEIQYSIDVKDFSDVDLSDIPTFLDQDGTDIRLANPQIYLNVNNPLYSFGTYATSGLEIIAHRKNQPDASYSLDAPGYFKVSDKPECTFCLSPTEPTKPYGDYAGAKHVPYTSLSNVLSGNRLPESLSIKMIDPCLPVQPVEKFKIGQDLGDVNGTYTFFAPLALKENSTIFYSDTEDGWSSEDLDKVTIQTLTVTLTVNSNLPVGVELNGYPVNSKGEQIRNVVIEGVTVAAGAKDQAVTLRTTGEITNLDGICFTAKVVAGASGEALTPEMGLTLKNIRAKVSGYYEDEL